MKSICVYCGSSNLIGQAFLDAAARMGKAIASRGLELWYGAGSTGLMGALADGALQAGGTVIGVIPALFNNSKLAHMNLSRLDVVESMHDRKLRLAEQADGFVAMPGGYGTFEEFFEILTWAQIGLHSKPIGLLNVCGYFNLLLEMVEHARLHGFIYDEHRTLFSCREDPDDLLSEMLGYQPPTGTNRWLTREDG